MVMPTWSPLIFKKKKKLLLTYKFETTIPDLNLPLEPLHLLDALMKSHLIGKKKLQSQLILLEQSYLL